MTVLSSFTFLSSSLPPLSHCLSLSLSLMLSPCHTKLPEENKARNIPSRLQFPSSSKLDEDLPFLLKSLSYPLKFNKSILKAPGTPHH
ncbi:hypothetical protein ACB092_07G021500 [Castanea dentata]